MNPKESVRDDPVLDDLDRRLVQALMIDGRASFTRLAELLGVSDQTVQRRYRRMRGEGLLRVVGLPVGSRVGLFESWLRVRCAPSAARAVAKALARRPDIAWVTISGGGGDVHAMTRARTRQDRDTLLLDRLPRTEHVREVGAHTILRKFFGGPDPWPGVDFLSAAQVAALTPPAPEPSPGRYALDAAESRLMAVLAQDGRTPRPALARATGLSESTVGRRVERLVAEGALFFDLELIPRHFGYETEATVLLTVDPARLAEVGTSLAGHVEVPFAAAVTGSANLLAVVVCTDTQHLYTYVTERLGPLPGVRQLEVIPALRSLKRAGMLVTDDRLTDPPSAGSRSVL
ncbi:Lrp/AsnC family transcriptional regulator [Streptomyces sp. NPDC093225]|uniref:Lrp/AsnC family transcriptional regulator n=1 Tax=Streptomyces sp. NPDC093225 TaxID=3366034 RepID=UPI0037F261DC